MCELVFLELLSRYVTCDEIKKKKFNNKFLLVSIFCQTATESKHRNYF